MSACPTCGHHLDGLIGESVPSISKTPPNSTVPVVRAQQEDPTSCQKEVDRLDVVIKRLNEQRAYFLRTINNAQTATRRLPPEVMSAIFLLTRPPIDFEKRNSKINYQTFVSSERHLFEEDGFQLVLGAVCHRWRQIAWSTPQLWTSISVKVCDPELESNASILNLYFQNVQGLPLTIELDLDAQWQKLQEAKDDEERSKSLASLEPIRTSVFVDNAHRIQTLFLSSPPPEWVSSIGPSLSRCQKLFLAYTSPESLKEDHLSGLPGLQALREISLESIYNPFKLHYPTITVIHLKKVPTSQCLDLLVKCPNLVEFESPESRPDDVIINSRSTPTIHGRVVLQNLERLRWRISGDIYGHAFLRHVRFARLHHLEWSGAHYDTEFEESRPADIHASFISFFSELPPTVRSLAIGDFLMTYQITHDLLCSIPPTVPITYLSIFDVTTEDSAMVMSMIGRPVAGLVEDREDGLATVDPSKRGGPRVLPFLQNLRPSIDPSNPWYDFVLEMVEALFESRGKDVPFRLWLMEDLANNWKNSETKKRVKKLMKAGYDLEIMFGSDRRLSTTSKTVEPGKLEFIPDPKKLPAVST
ncbi:hypothetical protein AN958_09713 [Leucoagaricus sp. SymC.cos]|nr:hypothetical protein AN958_09713 [Leucoagaricus sp. SymC.cos]